MIPTYLRGPLMKPSYNGGSLMAPTHLNNLEKTVPSEIEGTYNIRKQQTLFFQSVREN